MKSLRTERLIMKLLPLLLLVIACGSNDQPANHATGKDPVSVVKTPRLPPSGILCYEYGSGNDSILLQLNIGEKKITGNLQYLFHQKDKNIGRIENAVLNGDTLLADYRFNAEGKTTIRQVSFLLGDSTAREGYAEMREEKGKMVFKNPYNVRFDKSFPLRQKPCPE